MNTTNVQSRDLIVKNEFNLSKFLVRWEMILVYILVLTNVVLMIMKPNYYFASGTVSSIIQSGMDLSFMVLGMIFVLMLGDIDVSVSSIMIVSAMVMGILIDSGVNGFIAVIAGIAVGGVCGLINGLLIAKLKMSSVIVTIASALLFRGIVKIILDVNVLKNFPKWFSTLAWTNIVGVPLSLICFFAIAAIFAVVLHRTKFGRELYMIGNSKVVAQYSGLNVDRIRVIVFVLMGIMAGVSAIFFVGRMGGGVSSTMGKGYELDVIAIAVLGGVSTNGGKGKVYGPVIATLIMAFLIYTLGLLGVDANSRKILTGIILIIAVLIPNLNRQLIEDLKLKILFSNNRNLQSIHQNYATEVKGIKRKLADIKKGTTVFPEETLVKIKTYEDKIASLDKKYKQAYKELKDELKEENLKGKKKFAK